MLIQNFAVRENTRQNFKAQNQVKQTPSKKLSMSANSNEATASSAGKGIGAKDIALGGSLLLGTVGTVMAAKAHSANKELLAKQEKLFAAKMPDMSGIADTMGKTFNSIFEKATNAVAGNASSVTPVTKESGKVAERLGKVEETLKNLENKLTNTNNVTSRQEVHSPSIKKEEPSIHSKLIVPVYDFNYDAAIKSAQKNGTAKVAPPPAKEIADYEAKEARVKAGEKREKLFIDPEEEVPNVPPFKGYNPKAPNAKEWHNEDVVELNTNNTEQMAALNKTLKIKSEAVMSRPVDTEKIADGQKTYTENKIPANDYFAEWDPVKKCLIDSSGKEVPSARIEVRKSKAPVVTGADFIPKAKTTETDTYGKAS